MQCSTFDATRHGFAAGSRRTNKKDAHCSPNHLPHRRLQRRRETTFAKEFLPHEVKCLRFYNADELARGLSPLDPPAAAMKAGRMLLAENPSVDQPQRHLRPRKHAQRQDTYPHL